MKGLVKKPLGVTIITCTKRPEFINNVIRNYRNQRIQHKELIIIVNNDSINVSNYRMKAKSYKNITVYQMPEQKSLGACLNFGVNKAVFPFIAKFDDDDYYAPKYLADCLLALKKTNADVVGKRAHFMYLEGKKLLILRNPQAENRFVKTVAGATLVIRKRVFQKGVRFSNRSLGEDVVFCRDSVAKGFKIYSTGKYNFVAIRRKLSKGHTWTVTDNRLLSGKGVQLIRKVKNFKQYVSK